MQPKIRGYFIGKLNHVGCSSKRVECDTMIGWTIFCATGHLKSGPQVFMTQEFLTLEDTGCLYNCHIHGPWMGRSKPPQHGTALGLTVCWSGSSGNDDDVSGSDPASWGIPLALASPPVIIEAIAPSDGSHWIRDLAHGYSGIMFTLD